jgi:hypothetical protein
VWASACVIVVDSGTVIRRCGEGEGNGCNNISILYVQKKHFYPLDETALVLTERLGAPPSRDITFPNTCIIIILFPPPEKLLMFEILR